MSTAQPGPQGEPNVTEPSPSNVTAPTNGLADEKQVEREHEVGLAKLSRAGAITVGVIAALVSALITAPVTVWVAKTQIDAANARSEEEFLRSQRREAYGNVIAEIEGTWNAVAACQGELPTFHQMTPDEKIAVSTEALNAGVKSALSEAKATMVASNATYEMVLKVGNSRYDAVDHCLTAAYDTSTNSDTYFQYYETLQTDLDTIMSVKSEFITAARYDMSIETDSGT